VQISDVNFWFSSGESMKPQILFVHDQSNVRALAVSALELDHAVTALSGVAEAIELLAVDNAGKRSSGFDLIICAVHIQSSRNNLTIFDLLKWAKTNPQVKDIPFLFLNLESKKVDRYLSAATELAAIRSGGAGYASCAHFEAKDFLKLIAVYLLKESRNCLAI